MTELIAVVPIQDEVQFKCRICLADNVNLYSFDDLLVVPPDKQVPLAEALCVVVNESMENIKNPLLPHQVCENCVTQLRQSYIFKLSFTTSIQVWDKYLSQVQKNGAIRTKNIKMEIDDSDIGLEEVNFDNLNTKEKTSSNNPLTVNNSKKGRTRRKILPQKGQKQYPCPLCPDLFSAMDLKRHVKTHESLKRYLTAKGIPKYIKKVKFYAVQKPDVKPLISRSDPIEHKCIYCDIRLPAQEFNNHIDEHIKEGNVTCDICKRRFHDIKALRTHRVKHIKQHPFTCVHCGKGFLDEENYKYHLLAHNNVFMHQCQICSKEFANPDHLKRHIVGVHKTIGPYSKYKRFRFQCKNCLCRYRTQTECESHQCNPVSRDDYTKNWGKPYLLPTHELRTRMMSRFPGERNESRYPANQKILCHYCGKYVFHATAHMARHAGTVTIDDKGKQKGPLKKVLCQACGQYVAKYSLKVHIHRHHTGARSEKCPTCDRVFWTKQQLANHMRVHTGEKPYKCGFCGLGFSRYNNMRVHERIHIGVKAHVCNICGKGFYEKSYLKKHMRTHRDKYADIGQLFKINLRKKRGKDVDSD